MTRDTRAAYRGRERSLQATIDAATAEIAADARAKEQAAKVARVQAREVERARTKLTAADVAGAEFVRDASGWHPVVKVNAKTVTVRTGYSWHDRIPFARILKVHPPVVSA